MRPRVALAVLALAAWVAGSAIGTVVPERQAAATPLFQIERVHAGYTPSLEGTAPIFIAVLGSDARAALGTPVDRGLADSIHIVGINPAKRKASILGFPRDSYVNIPGYGSDKINGSMFVGGPELTVQTLEELTGIEIDYYVLTSFDGLKAIIDEIGGLIVDVPFPMHDSYSKTDFEPGKQRLDGGDVLAFSRDRHSIPAGDFGRSENQGRVFLSALSQFRKEFAKDPSKMLAWVAAGMRSIETDLAIQEILDLAFTIYSVPAKRVQNMVVPGSNGMVGDRAVVFISSTAEAIYRDMARDGLVQPRSAPASPTASALEGGSGEEA